MLDFDSNIIKNTDNGLVTSLSAWSPAGSEAPGSDRPPLSGIFRFYPILDCESAKVIAVKCDWVTTQRFTLRQPQ